jgi:hypothetical protein
VKTKKRRARFVNAPQYEMQIDGGFALVRETAPDLARIASEQRAARERAEMLANAQLSLF